MFFFFLRNKNECSVTWSESVSFLVWQYLILNDEVWKKSFRCQSLEPCHPPHLITFTFHSIVVVIYPHIFLKEQKFLCCLVFMLGTLGGPCNRFDRALLFYIIGLFELKCFLGPFITSGWFVLFVYPKKSYYTLHTHSLLKLCF